MTMITTSIPFEVNNRFTGVVTSDIDISNLQSVINNVSIGESGQAFLLNDQGISSPTQQKLWPHILLEMMSSIVKLRMC